MVTCSVPSSLIGLHVITCLAGSHKTESFSSGKNYLGCGFLIILHSCARAFWAVVAPLLTSRLLDNVNLPNWIEAVAALGMLVLTYLTLVVLKDYADDTKTIAKSSASQFENTQMPFLVVAPKPQNGWVIENQGFGPAINATLADSHLALNELRQGANPQLIVVERLCFDRYKNVYSRVG